MNLSNENRLLLYCARTEISETTLNQVKNLISLPLNWEGVLKSAFLYGVAPLLYHNLKGLQGIPQEVMDRFKEAYCGNMAKNMYLYAELRRILDAFHEKGVEVIVLKGAALAKTVYGDIALRPFGDIDLLIKKDDLSYAEEIMSSLKYRTHEGNKSQEWYRQNHFHLSPYICPDRSIVVEIHHHIINRPLHINIDKWWERSIETKIADCNVLIPSPEDMLLHLCLHLFNHSYDKFLLRVLCDISETLRYHKDELKWIQFRDEVHKYGIDKLVYSILYLVKRFRENNNNSLNWLKPTEVSIDLKLVSLMEKRIFTGDGIDSTIPGSLVQSAAVDRFWDGVRILIDRIFPTREVMSNWHSIRQSSKKLYLYYLARP